MTLAFSTNMRNVPRSVRVLTVNTHKGFAAFRRRFILHELREAIRSAASDIVFLQEVVGEHLDSTLRPSPHYEFLADQIWPQFAYGRNAVTPTGHFGNAVLSKYPILEHRNVPLAGADGERRGLLHCVLNVPAMPAPIHTVCVHFGLTEQQRRVPAEALAAHVRTAVPTGAPLIGAGDFNDWRQRVHARLQERDGLRETFAALHGRVARTFPARLPLLRLDRVYVRNLRPAQARALSGRPWSHLSDHISLAAELCL
jgi:endonuclease/exonuclease/phosphatase family metal-dependent hydrolase